MIPEELQGLSRLTADELAVRLKAYVQSAGGLLPAGAVEIAREAVRRARRAEAAERLVAEQADW